MPALILDQGQRNRNSQKMRGTKTGVLTKFKHCKLINTNLKYAKVMASSVKDCDFTGANMESTRLSATKFLDVDLKHCNFNGADIFASEFSHTDLTNANFERVKLALLTLDGAISTLDGGEITQAELFEDF